MIKMQANKGEWAELYTFIKILADRRVVAADMNLSPLNFSYKFLELFRNNSRYGNLTYSIESDKNIVISRNNGAVLSVVDREYVIDKSNAILNAIKSSTTPTFYISSADDAMHRLELQSIKAPSSDKSDLIATIEDHLTSRTPPIGFSIKSQLGSASTLLNASKSTNFTFRINNFSGDIERINRIDGITKIRDRLNAIVSQGGCLKFDHVASDIFLQNMKTIDTVMPNIISNMLFNYYIGNGRTMDELCKFYAQSNNFGLNAIDISFKLKSFLRAVALGMVPNTRWSTYLKTHGGFLIVKSDGSLLCYHLYNDDNFKDYLFANTKFDTPSSTRHNFGHIYTDDGVPMIDLNLQIRFRK